MDQFRAYVQEQQGRFLEEFFAFLRVPSVSAQGQGLDEAVGIVQRRLKSLGAEVRLLSAGGGNPVVYATLGSGERHLLIYDHYDVQPAEPLELWESPAFEPTIRDGKIFARGASDNKGNLMMRLQAIEAWQATQGTLPLSLAFVIEGEEEIGSPTLPAFCVAYGDLLRADGCLWETGEVDYEGRPVVECGAKGMQYVELIARGATADRHSSLAPVIPNPAWRLTWALATLKGADERVAIPGFYDAVRPPGAADEQALATIPDQDADMLEDAGLPAFLGGVRGGDMWRKLLFEPTCTICGLVSGYTGMGAKTVLPAEARAKIDFRLVPDMEPATVIQQLRAHLDTHGFSDIEIVDLSGLRAARTSLDAPIVQAMVQSGEATYGTPAVVYPTMPGTGPMDMLCQQIGTPACSGAGAGYNGDQIHAPNEHIRERDYWAGMEWMARFMEAFATTT